jgi:hypothetical protein
MKINHSIAIFILLIGFNFCNRGTKVDTGTGFKIEYKNIKVEDVFLQVDKTKLVSSEVQFGRTLEIVLNGIKGFKSENKKVLFDAGIKVIGEDGKAIFENQNLFQNADKEGWLEEDASQVLITLTLGQPLEADKFYDVEIRVFDKRDDQREIKGQVKIKIVN